METKRYIYCYEYCRMLNKTLFKLVFEAIETIVPPVCVHLLPLNLIDCHKPENTHSVQQSNMLIKITPYIIIIIIVVVL